VRDAIGCSLAKHIVHCGLLEIDSSTPLLGQPMLNATWANAPEHAADRLVYWGSRGRGFESRRPDSMRVSAGQKLAEALLYSSA
jgi:hypothetical protein